MLTNLVWTLGALKLAGKETPEGLVTPPTGQHGQQDAGSALSRVVRLIVRLVLLLQHNMVGMRHYSQKTDPNSLNTGAFLCRETPWMLSIEHVTIVCTTMSRHVSPSNPPPNAPHWCFTSILCASKSGRTLGYLAASSSSVSVNTWYNSCASWKINIEQNRIHVKRWCFSKRQSFPSYGLITWPDSDSDSDSCTMQKFHIGSDPDSDPLIEVYGIGTDICP